jgi:hypothetical protein
MTNGLAPITHGARPLFRLRERGRLSQSTISGDSPAPVGHGSQSPEIGCLNPSRVTKRYSYGQTTPNTCRISNRVLRCPLAGLIDRAVTVRPRHIGRFTRSSSGSQSPDLSRFTPQPGNDPFQLVALRRHSISAPETLPASEDGSSLAGPFYRNRPSQWRMNTISFQLLMGD